MARTDRQSQGSRSRLARNNEANLPLRQSAIGATVSRLTRHGKVNLSAEPQAYGTCEEIHGPLEGNTSAAWSHQEFGRDFDDPNRLSEAAAQRAYKFIKKITGRVILPN